MAFVFDPANYESVRKAIDVSLDDVTLPDSIIGLDIYAGEASRYIDRHLTPEQQAAQPESTNTAAIYYAASFLCTALRQVRRERMAGGELEYQVIDILAKGTELLGKAGLTISAIIVASEPDILPVPVKIPLFFTSSVPPRSWNY